MFRREFLGICSALPFLRPSFNYDPLEEVTKDIVDTISRPGLHLIVGEVKTGKSTFCRYLKLRNPKIHITDFYGCESNMDWMKIANLAMKHNFSAVYQLTFNRNISGFGPVNMLPSRPRYIATSIFETKRSLKDGCIDIECKKNRYGQLHGVGNLDIKTLFELGKHV